MKNERRAGLCKLEQWMAIGLVALKIKVLVSTWGYAQGFDAPHWLDVLRATHWFEPLPPPRALIASYHPPLSYLMGRLLVPFTATDVEASQILSTLSLIGAFVAFRDVLKTLGVLCTTAGLVLLYASFSLPLLVWLGIETGYDAPVFFWFVFALALAVRIFWKPLPEAWWRSPRLAFSLTGLGLVFAAGMLTKFNSLVALGLPLLIGLVRHGIARWRHFVAAAGFSIGVSAVVVLPLYAHRYLIPEKYHVPAAMDWQRPLDLTDARRRRDAEPLMFVARMLKPPTSSIVSSQYPVVDSFAHSLWLQTWKRDGCLGLQSDISLAFSNAYILFFPFPLVMGTAWFLLRRRKIPDAWRHLGWVLMVTTSVFCLSALAFAWSYPLWDWRVFKAKYVTPALFWIPFSCGVGLADEQLRGAASVVLDRTAIVLVAGFAILNHWLPVY